MRENDLDKDEKGGGFRVKDRRRFDSEGNERPDAAPQEQPVTTQSKPQPQAQPQQSATPRPPQQENRKVEEKKSPPAEESSVSFSSLIMSLAHQAILHLGLTDNPHGGPRQVDKEAAKETIDIISMLEAKTKGNLDDEEAHMIQEILHELRMTYVRVLK